MNARHIPIAALAAVVISTAAHAGSTKPESSLQTSDYDTHRHASRDDLVNSCIALPLWYANTAADSHTAATDALRDLGVDLCRVGARDAGVEMLEQALMPSAPSPIWADAIIQ